MKVLKFGGSSVGTPERIKGLLSILKKYHDRGDQFTVVFSAFSGVTDSLLDMSRRAAAGDESWRDAFEKFSQRHQDAIFSLVSGTDRLNISVEMERSHQSLANMLSGVFLVREASPRTMDYVVSFGERSSSFIIAAAMRQAGIPAQFLDARRVIKTNDNFVNAKVDFAATYPLIAKHYAENKEVQVVTGFIGSTADGLTTTLGRGGSDYTAAIIAAGLDAASIEIWTDVDGVLTADPRKVKKAFTIPKMTYAEAMEMSHFGAKVIYPPTLQPALQKRIPLYIKNTFNPDFEGTYISEKSSQSEHPVSGISSINKVAMLTLQGGGMFGVPGIAGRLFGSLAKSGISVILITQGSSEHSITFAIPPEVAAKAKQQVEAEFEYEIEKGLVEPLKIEENLSVIAIIGENMRYRPGISGRMFQALGKNGVNVVAIAQGSSELNISVVVAAADEAKAMNALHEAFFLSDTKELHLFMVGVGLIGSTLIEQIRAQGAFLKEKRGLEIKIVGLTNSRQMLFDEDGIDLANWKELLSGKGEKLSLPQFVERMKGLNLSNSIFVDNTASAEPPQFYEEILGSSISISTPNKQATSGPYEQYQRLKAVAARRGVPFLYETNVGAGLPVIGTLEDLITSGDRILKIEGVLSGTMSFIFNNFKPGQSFSAIVREAKRLGYTEPDPRDDLGGADVRRKLLILAREAGLPLEAADVRIESILPQAAQDAPNVDAFFEELEKADAHFEQMAADAASDGRALRMIASLDKATNEATIGLRAVDASHPFYSLSGSDNMIVFTTERYKERPLVVRGPGAGAAVTAAGVFAEVVRIGGYLGN
jgi:aspartokinase/homoserine dehydrogenase 1